jgi:hypothetical protein
MFIFKKKEIVLDCFTYVPVAYDYAKIDKASKFYPDWWKNTSKINDENKFATIKNCVAFIDFYNKGIVIPSWFEMRLTLLKTGDPKIFEWESSNHFMSTNDTHNQSQFINFCEQNGHNLKINSPWKLKTKEEIYFAWTQPTWNHKDIFDKLHILPAVINFKYQNHTHVNFFFKSTESIQKIHIPALMPLIIMHPLTEKRIKIKNHLISEKEYNSINSIDSLLLKSNTYDLLSFYKRKKNIINFTEKKCPFKNHD